MVYVNIGTLLDFLLVRIILRSTKTGSSGCWKRTRLILRKFFLLSVHLETIPLMSGELIRKSCSYLKSTRKFISGKSMGFRKRPSSPFGATFFVNFTLLISFKEFNAILSKLFDLQYS